MATETADYSTGPPRKSSRNAHRDGDTVLPHLGERAGVNQFNFYSLT